MPRAPLSPTWKKLIRHTVLAMAAFSILGALFETIWPGFVLPFFPLEELIVATSLAWIIWFSLFDV